MKNKNKKKRKRSLIYNGLEQFVDYWVMPCNYKYLVIGLIVSIADQDNVCKLGSVCNALPPVPWSQLRSEIKEHFIGWCCQLLKHSILRLFFSEFPLEKKKLVFTNYYETKHLSSLLIKLQKSCYTTALLENFVAIFPETIFLHATNFCSLYCHFSVPQSLAIFIHIYSNQIYLSFLHVLQSL